MYRDQPVMQARELHAGLTLFLPQDAPDQLVRPYRIMLLKTRYLQESELVGKTLMMNESLELTYVSEFDNTPQVKHIKPDTWVTIVAPLYLPPKPAGRAPTTNG